MWKRQGDNEKIPESVRSRIFAMSKPQTQPLHLRTPEQCPLENREPRLRTAKRWRARATWRVPFQRGLSTVDPMKRWIFRLSTWASDSDKQRPDGPIAIEMRPQRAVNKRLDCKEGGLTHRDQRPVLWGSNRRSRCPIGWIPFQCTTTPSTKAELYPSLDARRKTTAATPSWLC